MVVTSRTVVRRAKSLPKAPCSSYGTIWYIIGPLWDFFGVLSIHCKASWSLWDYRGGGRGDGIRIASDGGDGSSGFSSAMAVALHGAVGGDGYLIVLLLDATGEDLLPLLPILSYRWVEVLIHFHPQVVAA